MSWLGELERLAWSGLDMLKAWWRGLLAAWAVPLTVIAASVAVFSAVFLIWWLQRRRTRRLAGEQALARVVDVQTQTLKATLRRRLSEAPRLFDDHLNGAPTMGAREAFESDIEAAARSVLREAGGEASRARELLRDKLEKDGAAGSGRLNGSEAGTWRQLGALALADGSGDAILAYRRAADLEPTSAETQMLIGVLHMRAGNLKAAEAAFRRQIDLADKPADVQARYRGHTMLGDACAARYAADEALDQYRAAQAEILSLLDVNPNQPGLRRDLSVTYDRMGDVAFGKGELGEALEYYRQGLQVAESLARSAGRENVDLYHDLSVSYDRIGDLLDSKGDVTGALAHFRKSLALTRALVRHDPNNTEWAWDLSSSYERVADMLNALDRQDEALKLYHAGLAIAERLAGGRAGDPGAQRDLAVSYHKIGSLEALRGHAGRARDLLEKGRAIIARLDRIASYQAQWRSDLSKFDTALKTIH